MTLKFLLLDEYIKIRNFNNTHSANCTTDIVIQMSNQTDETGWRKELVES